MHCEYLSAAALRWACCAGVPAVGASALHASEAALNFGLSGPRSLPDPRSTEIAISPLLFGSGKSLMPCARMHCAYFSAELFFDAVEAALTVVVDPSCATPGPFEPPPHAAARSAKPASASAASFERRRRTSR